MLCDIFSEICSLFISLSLSFHRLIFLDLISPLSLCLIEIFLRWLFKQGDNVEQNTLFVTKWFMKYFRFDGNREGKHKGRTASPNVSTQTEPFNHSSNSFKFIMIQSRKHILAIEEPNRKKKKNKKITRVMNYAESNKMNDISFQIHAIIQYFDISSTCG